MSPLENLLPYARSYLEGIILDRDLPQPLRDCAELPECWETMFFPLTRARFVTSDRLEISQKLDAPQGEEEESYVAECGVDPLYPFYYYEVSFVKTPRDFLGPR